MNGVILPANGVCLRHARMVVMIVALSVFSQKEEMEEEKSASLVKLTENAMRSMLLLGN